ncbi:MAG: hypothetical protein ACRD2G_09380 [Terriglobia bacterium]
MRITLSQSSKRALALIGVAFLLMATWGVGWALGQNLGTAPQTGVAVQGETGAQPEGAFLNMINWVANVIAPIGAGGAVVGAIVAWLTGRGFGRWIFAAAALLGVSGITRLLEFWIASGTGGVT